MADSALAWIVGYLPNELIFLCSGTKFDLSRYTVIELKTTFITMLETEQGTDVDRQMLWREIIGRLSVHDKIAFYEVAIGKGYFVEKTKGNAVEMLHAFPGIIFEQKHVKMYKRCIRQFGVGYEWNIVRLFRECIRNGWEYECDDYSEDRSAMEAALLEYDGKNEEIRKKIITHAEVDIRVSSEALEVLVQHDNLFGPMMDIMLRKHNDLDSEVPALLAEAYTAVGKPELAAMIKKVLPNAQYAD